MPAEKRSQLKPALSTTTSNQLSIPPIKVKLEKRQRNDVEIVEAMKVYDRAENPICETLPEAHRLYRLKVVRTFLLAGVPLTKLNMFKDLLEEYAYRLTDRRHMSDMIPFILQQEKDLVKREMNGKHVSIVFDGTSVALKFQ